MKAYTDLEHSKVLAEILPLESADMGYLWNGTSFCEYPVSNQTIFKKVENIPCWSLAALLSVLPSATLDSSNNHYYRLYCMERFTEWYDNAVDACNEMIIRLYELNLL